MEGITPFSIGIVVVVVVVLLVMALLVEKGEEVVNSAAGPTRLPAFPPPFLPIPTPLRLPLLMEVEVVAAGVVAVLAVGLLREGIGMASPCSGKAPRVMSR